LRLSPGREDRELGWRGHQRVWGWRLRRRDHPGVGALGVQPRHRRDLRCRPVGQHPCRGDGAAQRHGTGRGDRQILRARPSGVPSAPRRLRPLRTGHLATPGLGRRVTGPTGDSEPRSQQCRIAVQIWRPRRICRQIQARTTEYRCGMALGKNKRTSPQGAWGDVRTAQVIGLPGVHNAPCRSVSASARENRVLTQARGAEPYRGMLRVGARCCSCWEPRPGGRIFSADPTLACRRSLPRGLLRNLDRHKGAGTCHPSPAPGG
jgi:hypothetical protein